MIIKLAAKGSGAKPYSVEFAIDGGTLTAHCNCQAGTFGNICKHKTELLAGKASRLANESELDSLTQLMTIVERAPDLAIANTAIRDAEKLAKTQPTSLKKAKAALAKMLRDGVKIT